MIESKYGIQRIQFENQDEALAIIHLLTQALNPEDFSLLTKGGGDREHRYKHVRFEEGKPSFDIENTWIDLSVISILNNLADTCIDLHIWPGTRSGRPTPTIKLFPNNHLDYIL